jgi:hypothetical protein
MEFIQVKFDPSDIRDVVANGNVIGKTEAVLMLPTDFYEITLSGSGYAPPEWKGLISGTLATQPMNIRFGKAAPSAGT